jgi:anti-anti-sigma factor
MVALRVAPGPAPRTVSLAGELDAATSGGIADTVTSYLPGAGDARLDLSELDALDPAGLRVLLKIAEDLGRGSRLVLLFPTRQVRMALEASGVLESGKLVVAPVGPMTRTIDLDAEPDPLGTPSDLPFIWLG